MRIENGGGLWAITCYFNPVGYQRRRKNYLRFRDSLTIPLITVELSYNDRFELKEDDADVLVCLRGRDVLWQKERLLNVALDHLPADCENVAWLDCDVLLAEKDWVVTSERLLERYPLIQLFSHLVHLGPAGRVEDSVRAPAASRRTSLGYRWGTRSTPHDLFLRPEASSEARCTSGMAWAAKRGLLERHGLYDAMVLGMGDKMIAAAAIGRHEDAIRAHELNASQSDHYERWAVPFHDAVRGQVGYREGTAFHLWHGDLSDRKYIERYTGFDAFEFDPCRDLALDKSGVWNWNTNKSAMHRHVEQYFRQRREDGRHLPLVQTHHFKLVAP